MVPYFVVSAAILTLFRDGCEGRKPDKVRGIKNKMVGKKAYEREEKVQKIGALRDLGPYHSQEVMWPVVVAMDTRTLISLV